jgi:hypothetical protein
VGERERRLKKKKKEIGKIKTKIKRGLTSSIAKGDHGLNGLIFSGRRPGEKKRGIKSEVEHGSGRSGFVNCIEYLCGLCVEHVNYWVLLEIVRKDHKKKRTRARRTEGTLFLIWEKWKSQRSTNLL